MAKEVSARWPHIEYEEMLIDNASLGLVGDPSKLDVMVLPNLYGDIIRFFFKKRSLCKSIS